MIEPELFIKGTQMTRIQQIITDFVKFVKMSPAWGGISVLSHFKNNSDKILL